VNDNSDQTREAEGRSGLHVLERGLRHRAQLRRRTGPAAKGDHAYVQRHPADFIPESEVLGGASLPDPANVPPVDPPEPIGRVKLKVLPGLGSRADDLVGGGTEQQVTYRGKTYRTGETFAAQGADAAYLLDTGCVEIVGSPLKRLRPSRSAGLPRTVT
jgi:hypothetical protein